MTHLPIVAVIGSGVDEHLKFTEPVGCWLATQQVHLLTGGGGGVMTAVSRAFAGTPGRHGLVIGILPSKRGTGKAPSGYPNQWVEIPIATHLPYSGERGTDVLSRNHINVLTADIVIVLPGRAGTSSEAHLAVRYNKPIAAFVASVEDVPNLPSTVRICHTIDELKEFVTAALKT
jgi:uncharacterized protein (TIGR00725 family)